MDVTELEASVVDEIGLAVADTLGFRRGLKGIDPSSPYGFRSEQDRSWRKGYERGIRESGIDWSSVEET